jgi:hypothetical protein
VCTHTTFYRIVYDYDFELDPDGERQMRALVTERGLDDGLPTQWTLRDFSL